MKRKELMGMTILAGGVCCTAFGVLFGGVSGAIIGLALGVTFGGAIGSSLTDNH